MKLSKDVDGRDKRGHDAERTSIPTIGVAFGIRLDQKPL
jgi:hypothetical protein